LPFSSCEPPSKEQAEVGIEMVTRDKIDAAVRILAEAASPARIVLSMRRTTYKLLVLLTFLLTSAFVWAADYPVRPVTVLVAFPPGGASDVLARIVTRKLEEVLGQPFIIENRPGAGGNVAAEAVARAAPDGYTLLNGNNAILATNAALYKKINFDAVADFAPVGLIGSQANILVVNPALPVRSMAELISLARPTRASSTLPHRGMGWRRISQASCSRRKRRSTSSTFRTRVRPPRCRM
jgi:tripartite-type tricarboxylate transporter receptor subunit TctC